MRRRAILMILVIINNRIVAKILKLQPSHYTISIFPRIRSPVKGEIRFFFSIFGKFL
jgi:hypothetical protein